MEFYSHRKYIKFFEPKFLAKYRKYKLYYIRIFEIILFCSGFTINKDCEITKRKNHDVNVTKKNISDFYVIKNFLKRTEDKKFYKMFKEFLKCVERELSKNPYGAEIVYFYPTEQNIELEEKEDTKEFSKANDQVQNILLQNTKECLFSGLNYNSNSCYQDSILTVLLSQPSNFIDENILNKAVNDDIFPIQEELIRLAEGMRNEKQNLTCIKLRALLSKLKTIKKYQNFHGRGMQDAGEFLLFIFSLFNVEGVTRRHSSYVVENDNPIITRDILNTESPIINIHSETIRDQKEYNLENAVYYQELIDLDEKNMYFYAKTGKYYARRIESYRIIDASYLIFYVNRLYKDGRHVKRSTTDIIAPSSLYIENKKLKLFGVILHSSLHYTAYIKCQGQWYMYNDNPSGSRYRLEKIEKPDWRKTGILFFYKNTKIEI